MSAPLKSLGQAAILGLLGLGAAGLLGAVHRTTGPVIELRIKQDLERSLAEVLPPEIRDNDPTEDTLQVSGNPTRFHLARSGGVTTGVAFETMASGYSGAIRMVVGVDRHGKLFGVRVVSHSETPGLGDKIEVVKSDWIRGFDGKSLSNPGPEGWAVKKDGGEFDALSGATITPRAVVRGVLAGLKLVAERETELFSESNPEGGKRDGQ